MPALLLTGIGELVTHDPAHGPGLGVVRDAAVVVEGTGEGWTVQWTGPAAQAPPADQAQDVGGRAVIPGFVDSHSHLLFAGDRAEEFAARMAGTAYDGGGIRTTVAATRAATDEQLEANLFRHYGISYGTAGPPSGKPVSRGAGRTMLHKYHAPAVNHAG